MLNIDKIVCVKEAVKKNIFLPLHDKTYSYIHNAAYAYDQKG